MTIKYANGWWGIYGADPYHVPKFKRFLDAVRWAKEHRGLEVPTLHGDYADRFPNRAHIIVHQSSPYHRGEFEVYQGEDVDDRYPSLDAAINAAHKLAATTR